MSYGGADKAACVNAEKEKKRKKRMDEKRKYRDKRKIK